MIHEQSSGSKDNKLARITTGEAQLDAILDGGFPANSINILMGEPGSGKTILAERLIFANVDSDERPILYLTTLSEPLEKVVRYLQQFEFFDEEKLTSGAIVYQSIGQELESQGISALIPTITDAIKTLGPKIIVIDSFKAIHDLSTSISEMRRMLYAFSGILTAYDITAFLVGEYSENMISTLPEFAVADGMVELARKKHGTRDERYLRVLKLRGSNYQEGLHAFRITGHGLDVFPRLTSPPIPAGYQVKTSHTSTGIPGLDAMLKGGVWTGSVTLVEGQTGAGKTTLGLQFALDALKHNEPALYVNFQENPNQLARTIHNLGGNIEEARANGLHLLYMSPVELQIDSILVGLFRAIEEKKVKRLVIDSIGDLLHAASDTQRLIGYLYALGQHFVVSGISSILTMEITAAGESPLMAQVSAMSDTILRLRTERRGDTVRRTLQVVKARGTDQDLNIRELRISTAGIEVS